MDPSYLTTIGGWAAILTVGGYIYWQSQQKAHKPAAGKASVQSGKQMTDYEKNVASAATATKKKAEKALKPKPKPAAPTTDTPATTSSSVKYDPEAEAAADKALNNEFARQYATAKSGTKFEGAKKDEKRQKSIKQSRAREIDTAQAQAQTQTKTSAPSSTTGDADDDLSEANSPVVPTADSRDVSDMLEQTAPGPSVLRLTDTDAVKQKPKKEKKLEVVETKKQRQNRKKAEAAKAQRAQDELERKKLEEAQRRQSRIAEGRAAKDGSAFMAATQENAWNPKATNGDASATVQPLDTYEQKPAAAAPKPAAPAPAVAAPPKQTSGTWMSSMPSEEEQLKMIQDEEAWNEVTSKKKKSKQSVADSPAASTPAENGVSTSASAAAPKAPVNGKQSKPILTSNSSFAALTPDETANDESEVEEEWEV